MTINIPMRAFAAALLASSLLTGAAAMPAFAEVVLYKGLGGEPQTLDPAHTSINVEEFVLKDLYEGLTVYDAGGKIVPGAAESWTLSKDGLTLTFKIRANAKWSNGDPLTAADFVASFQRVESPKEAAGYANILYPIKNAEAINTGKADVSTLGVKAVDDKTLEITLERPTPYMLELLAHQTALPVNKASIDKLGPDWIKPGNLVSNGAYMLQENVANDHITLVKNPNHWDAANVKIDKLVAYPLDDQAAAQRRFLAGEVDLTYQFQADQIGFLKGKVGDQVHVTPSLATYYYAFDERKPPFNDVRVRQALSMAIDRDFLAEKIFAGAKLPTYSLVPDGIPNYTPAKLDYADTTQLDREDKAKALLKDAGYGEGGKPIKIEIRYNTNENHKKAALAVADNWKVLGVEVSILNQDIKTHYAFLQSGAAFDVARAGWTADYADPENFLTLTLSTNKTFNYGAYNNPDYDALIKKSYDERDPVARMKILHDAEAMIMRDVPITPMVNDADLWLVSNKIKGYQDNAVNQHLTRFLSKE
jgi:oligopeptide transport system substrate-binding protein